MSARLSNFARSLSVETAFTVLAIARSLKAAGKDIVELEIGDSPFDSTAAARAGGMEAIKGEPVTDSDDPGGMSGIPDPDPDADDDRKD